MHAINFTPSHFSVFLLGATKANLQFFLTIYIIHFHAPTLSSICFPALCLLFLKCIQLHFMHLQPAIGDNLRDLKGSVCPCRLSFRQRKSRAQCFLSWVTLMDLRFGLRPLCITEERGRYFASSFHLKWLCWKREPPGGSLKREGGTVRGKHIRCLFQTFLDLGSARWMLNLSWVGLQETDTTDTI